MFVAPDVADSKISVELKCFSMSFGIVPPMELEPDFRRHSTNIQLLTESL